MALRPNPEGRSLTPAPTLWEVKRRLDEAPSLAVDPARALLRQDPASRPARLLLGAALRRSGDPAGALRVLGARAAAAAAWGLAFEIGAAHALLGDAREAIGALETALRLNPAAAVARHALADQRILVGEAGAAVELLGAQVPGLPADEAFRLAAAPLFAGDAAAAAKGLLARFGLALTDPLVAVMAADAALQTGAAGSAAALLRPLVGRFPAFGPARRRLAEAELRRRRAPEALEVLRAAPGPPTADLAPLHAAALTGTGSLHDALALYDVLARKGPADPKLLLSRGHVRKALADHAGAAADYRSALALDPALGEAYWSLANLKLQPFAAGEVLALERLFSEGGARGREDWVAAAYALGKAREDRGEDGAAFDAYAAGAALRRALRPFDLGLWRRGMARLKAASSADLFRAGSADLAAEGPIFIVGLPRSGSTLVEQILASHSKIEGLSELSDLGIVLEDLAFDLARFGLSYPEDLHRLERERLLRAGRVYLARAARHRRAPSPFFTDKFPGNAHHLALIHLALPGARIVEVRRDPMACGFSLFRQHFAEGQDWSYDLGDIAAVTAGVSGLLDHVAAAAPGRIIRVVYEDLVRSPETEIPRLLEALGLEPEPGCLAFHETRRPVRTASALQVRQPLSTTGLHEWRRHEARLRPLAEALRAEGIDPCA